MPIKVLLILSCFLLVFSACMYPSTAPSSFYPAGPHAGASHSGSYHSGAPAVYNHEPAGVVSVHPQASWSSHTMYNAYEFAGFMQTLRDEDFDDSRVELVQRTSRTVAFYSEQVAEILGVIEFESHRVDAAVMLYPRTLDARNWHLIKRSLEFDASFSEIESQILGMRPLGQ